MKRSIFAALALILMTGCSEEARVEEAAREYLIDPDSARFGKITILKTDEGEGACVTANAKNRMGGYTGDQQIVLEKGEDGEWQAKAHVAVPHDTCVNVFLDRSDEPSAEQ
jgi:hypothetical protein|tara:strand:+ start:6859 stop:7191 length:333 start_codon:yes stop_codon:yes gene_type:complete